jgi:type VI secretion system secreted protein VgrG
MIRDIRIFQNMTTPDIIKEVLKTSDVYSFEYECRFHGTYSPREYCVQYRETNMDFITRLMAEEGMFFYYEIKKDAHFLVFGDSYICHKDISGDPEVLFSEKGQLVNDEEVVTVFNDTNQITTGAVQLRDYDFTHPSYKPVASAKSTEYDGVENYDYPGNLVNEKINHRLITMNLERETQKRHTMEGASVCRQFTAGHTFTLIDKLGLKPKVEYLLTSVIHTGTQPQSLHELTGSTQGNTYSNTFTCVPRGIPFRPNRLPKPSVMGVQTAIVTGPKNEEIYTDEYGRIKVQFHWDRLGKNDALSSCWMRVAQSWAGYGFGAMFIPRIGQEVIVDFIDGDPDRPIVTGSVYNGRNILPYNLPAEKTKSTIKTETTPGGKGFNELRFEDKKDQEEIYIHGQKDWNIEILNDKGQNIGHDEKLDVKNDRTKTVGHDQNEIIGNDKGITVTKIHTESVGENMSVKIGKNRDENTGENKTVTVGKNIDEQIGENAKINVIKNRDLSIGGNSTLATGKNHTERVGGDHSITVGENGKISIGNDLSIAVNEKTRISSGQQLTFICGKASLIINQDGKVLFNGHDISVKASGKLTIKGKTIHHNPGTIGGSSIEVMAP